MYIIFTICICFGLALSGCGRNSPLQGRVTFEDGAPLTMGMVNFTSESGLSRGNIKSDGTYQVGSLKAKDGLPPGTYKVYITGAMTPIETVPKTVQRDSEGNPIEAMGSVRLLVDPKYITADTTPLTCTVPAPKNRFDFTVMPPEQKKK